MISASGHLQQSDGDRKDQAIGRIIRLLSALPLKELDAMADRLGRNLATLRDRRSKLTNENPPPATEHTFFGEGATTTTERCADTVGQ